MTKNEPIYRTQEDGIDKREKEKSEAAKHFRC